MITCLLTSGRDRWRILGTYLPPGDTNEDIKTCQDIISDMERFIEGRNDEIILLGDLNTRLKGDRNRDITVSTRLETWGLECDVSQHFFLRKRFKGKATWSSPDRSCRIQCEYIMSTQRKWRKKMKYVHPKSMVLTM